MEEQEEARPILLVQRATSFRAAVRQVLVGAGYDVEVAEDGPSAQARLREEPIPVLLVLGDGITAESLRRPELPVIRLTGQEARPRAPQPAWAAAAGGELALQTPLDVEELLNAVRRFAAVPLTDTPDDR